MLVGVLGQGFRGKNPFFRRFVMDELIARLAAAEERAERERERAEGLAVAFVDAMQHLRNIGR